MTAQAPPADGEPAPTGDAESAARAICLRQLDRRARTRSELAATLKRRGVPDGTARSVLDRFAEVGLIDDTALAGAFAVAAHRERGLARRAIAVKLRQRGIDEQTGQAALAQLDAESEADGARLLVAQRRRSLGGLEPQVQARRLLGLLARRGYPPDLALQIVREALDCPEIGDVGA